MHGVFAAAISALPPPRPAQPSPAFFGILHVIADGARRVQRTYAMPATSPTSPLRIDPAKLTARAHPSYVTCDANEAVASVAHRLSEFIAIYPITPSSPMAESCDEWSAVGRKNLWGEIPRVVQLQSEGGVAGAVHGGLLGGSLTTTFTASQGLLLMVPNLYKIAGELLPFALHVTARSLAAQGLSIFGDHQDVMACRQTGCALLCSNHPQESQDLALIAHAATLRGRLPVIHFFDGFRTSHEISKIVPLADDVLREMIDTDALAAFRARALTPDRPKIHGTAQNPDVYFQGRETVNTFVNAFPDVVSDCMDKFATLTGRKYSLVEYYGHPQAERAVVCMGSGVEALQTAAEHLNASGGRVGVIAIRLFQPFPLAAFLEAIPSTVRTLGVVDRTKEPGAVGEPLFQSVLSALARAEHPTGVPTSRVFGGRYGLGSKEFTPSMALAVFQHVNSARPRHGFTIGIHDDVTHTSLRWDDALELEAPGVRRCVFVGLGADGTVGANKNSIKIIGEQTDFFAQGYFVYDSKKSGSVTVSHLRFGPEPIHAPWLIRSAQFVACSQFNFVGRHEILGYAAPGATVLLDSPHDPETTWAKLPRDWKQTLLTKKIRLYVIDANGVASAAGMGRRTNTVLQTCFFALAGVLPQDEAIAHIKKAITKTYARKGDKVVQMNHAAVDAALAGLREVTLPATLDEADAAPTPDRYAAFTDKFHRDVTARLLAGEGDLLPVSAMPVDGGWPTATTKLEKRSIALELPQWDAGLCIQCNKCVFVCPHAAIRATHVAPTDLVGAPESLTTVPFRSNEQPGRHYLLQVAPDDCTGCSLCVQVCPAKDKSNPRHKALNLVPAAPRMETERLNWDFFESLPSPDRAKLDLTTVKGSQFAKPLFEFSGACAGCGETPYLKLLTQLLGDRLTIANATGCSSIYGGNLPTTPYSKDANGRGPAWANSLFEDTPSSASAFATPPTSATPPRAACSTSSRRASTTTSSPPSEPPRPPPRPTSPPAAKKSPSSAPPSPKSPPTPKPRASPRSPTTSSKNPSGSSAATAGPTTSATAASITSSPLAPTSKSSSSTPRFIPTPAGNPPSPPPWAPSPNSPPAAKPPAKKTSPSWPCNTATFTSPASPSAPRTPRLSRPCAKPKPTTGPPSSSPTAIASPTATTSPTASTNKNSPSIPATGRSSATTPAAPTRANPPSTSIRLRPRPR